MNVQAAYSLEHLELKGFNCKPKVLIILGSSFSAIVNDMTIEKNIPFSEMPGLPKATAPMHSGNLIFGKIEGCDVLIMQGRLHVYEGYPIHVTTYPVRFSATLGIKKMITTNLSGGINPAFEKGDLMVVEDHINLSGQTPLTWNSEQQGSFTDMYEAYSLKLISLLARTAMKSGIKLHKGVLAYLTGPSFETRAELRMLRILGADAIGWSLVPEILEARRCGMEACGIVCISDIADPDRFQPVDLDGLYNVGLSTLPILKKLLFEFILQL